jgi:hypothetical protein
MIWGLINFDPKDRRSLEQWALWHQTDHVEIKQAIQRALGLNLTVWPLYPFKLSAWNEWALRHQSAHNEMNTVSGLTGSDLTEVDFSKRDQREEWHLSHFNEHLAQRTRYGI